MQSRLLAVVFASAIAISACGSSSDGADVTLPEITLVTTSSVPTFEPTDSSPDSDSVPGDTEPAGTTTPSGTDATPSTEGATTVPGTPSTIDPATTAPTTVAPTTTESVESRFPLNTNGLGTISFGADPEGTIAFVTSFLGAPTGDTGWVDPFTIGACGGAELRQVNWGSLQLEFGDVSDIVQGRRHFYAYTYGMEGTAQANPTGLSTAEGITIGSTVGGLIAAYPRVELLVGDEFIPDNFVVNDNLRGLLSGLSDGDVVEVIIGGLPCEG